MKRLKNLMVFVVVLFFFSVSVCAQQEVSVVQNLINITALEITKCQNGLCILNFHINNLDSVNRKVNISAIFYANNIEVLKLERYGVITENQTINNPYQDECVQDVSINGTLIQICNTFDNYTTFINSYEGFYEIPSYKYSQEIKTSTEQFIMLHKHSENMFRALIRQPLGQITKYDIKTIGDDLSETLLDPWIDSNNYFINLSSKTSVTIWFHELYSNASASSQGNNSLFYVNITNGSGLLKNMTLSGGVWISGYSDVMIGKNVYTGVVAGNDILTFTSGKDGVANDYGYIALRYVVPANFSGAKYVNVSGGFQIQSIVETPTIQVRHNDVVVYSFNATATSYAVNKFFTNNFTTLIGGDSISIVSIPFDTSPNNVYAYLNRTSINLTLSGIIGQISGVNDISTNLSINNSLAGVLINYNASMVQELNDTALGTSLLSGSCYSIVPGATSLNWSLIYNTSYSGFVNYTFVSSCSSGGSSGGGGTLYLAAQAVLESKIGESFRYLIYHLNEFDAYVAFLNELDYAFYKMISREKVQFSNQPLYYTTKKDLSNSFSVFLDDPSFSNLDAFFRKSVGWVLTNAKMQVVE